MRRLIATLLLLGSALFITGCFQSTVRVVVKADGSGTIAVSQTFDNETIDYLRGDLPREQAIAQLFSSERLKQLGQTYGQDLTVLGQKASQKDHGAGYLAIYQFSDINQVQIPPGKTGEAIRFNRKNNTLTVQMPDLNKATADSGNPPASLSRGQRKDAVENLIAQLRKNNNPYKLTGRESLADIGSRMLGSLQATVELDLPAGTDVSSASHKNASKPHRVNLVKVDGKVLADDGRALEGLLAPSTNAKAMLTAPGVTLEAKPRIQFKLP